MSTAANASRQESQVSEGLSQSPTCQELSEPFEEHPAHSELRRLIDRFPELQQISYAEYSGHAGFLFRPAPVSSS